MHARILTKEVMTVQLLWEWPVLMTFGSAAVLIIIKQFLLNLFEQIAGQHFEISCGHLSQIHTY